MNTTEHLVEVYYRQKGYLTATDVKIEKGNNRQFDLLAAKIGAEEYFHVEISVAHGQQWQDTLEELKKKVEYKFFGLPKDLRPDNLKTDFAKGKNYLTPIRDTYRKFGMEYEKVIRVWCTWSVRESDNEILAWKETLANENALLQHNFEILSFRDMVLPFLLDNIGTAYYDDELLRTMSLIKEYTKQTKNLK